MASRLSALRDICAFLFYAQCTCADATLDSHGFTLQSHPTAVSDFEDAAEVSDTYYSEIMDLVKKVSGASKVVCAFVCLFVCLFTIPASPPHHAAVSSASLGVTIHRAVSVHTTPPPCVVFFC